MQLLLDTHVFLWAASDPSILSKSIVKALQDTKNDVYVSAAVAWEIAVKYGLGKLTLPSAPSLYVSERIALLGFRSLAITQAHALAASELPHFHRDPFDRIMIAQAKVEEYTFITDDADSLKYPANVRRARPG